MSVVLKENIYSEKRVHTETGGPTTNGKIEKGGLTRVEFREDYRTPGVLEGEI